MTPSGRMSENSSKPGFLRSQTLPRTRRIWTRAGSASPTSCLRCLPRRSKNIEMQERFGLDSSADAEWLKTNLTETAAGISAFIEITGDELRALRRQRNDLPTDADIAARLRVSEERMRETAAWSTAIFDLMSRTGMDVAAQRQNLIVATGQITSDILDYTVFEGLAGRTVTEFRNWLLIRGPLLAFTALLVAAILLATWLIARAAGAMVKRVMEKTPLRISALLHQTMIATTRRIILMIGILIALSQLGVSVGHMLAGLGVIGIIVGLALQSTLSNYTAGWLILFYRPFDVGDVVQLGGASGVTSMATGAVSRMTLANTTIITDDHQLVMVPNNTIWSAPIRNLTDQGKLRAAPVEARKLGSAAASQTRRCALVAPVRLALETTGRLHRHKASGRRSHDKWRFAGQSRNRKTGFAVARSRPGGEQVADATAGSRRAPRSHLPEALCALAAPVGLALEKTVLAVCQPLVASAPGSSSASENG